MNKKHKESLRLFVFLFFVLCLAGCGPEFTYPKDTVEQSVKKICKEEYKLNVDVKLVENTLGAAFYVDRLIDESGQIDKEIHENMGRVSQTLIRVALSSDADIRYCALYLRQKGKSMEIVITRSVEDARKANADALGIEESMNRTVFSQGAYKAVTVVQGKDSNVSITPEFVIKNITQEDFLTDQITQRIRYDLAKQDTDKKKSKKDEDASNQDNNMALVDGNYKLVGSGNHFRFSIIGFGATQDARQILLSALKIVNRVFEGYKYTNFEQVEIQDYLHRNKLVLPKQAMLDYQNKKLSEEEILEKFMTQSRSIKDSFKLFNFSNPTE